MYAIRRGGSQELTPRMRANLVSYGERMSTRIFAAHLRSRGIASKQFDAWRIGFICSDEDFENGEVLPETYPAVKQVCAKRLQGEAVGCALGKDVSRRGEDEWPEICVVLPHFPAELFPVLNALVIRASRPGARPRMSRCQQLPKRTLASVALRMT
jgi:hypothetical protein